MIVVAIIGLLAAIATPNLLRARISANEGAVKYDLRTFGAACESYRSSHSQSQYPSSLSDLTGASPPYLDATWNNVGSGGAGKHGFTMTYASRNSGYGFTLLASPISGQAVNTYCMDHTGTIESAASGVTAESSGCATGASNPPPALPPVASPFQ